MTSINATHRGSEILAFTIEFLVQAAFLALALWIMIKVQKLEYNIPGLLGAAALASGLLDIGGTRTVLSR